MRTAAVHSRKLAVNPTAKHTEGAKVSWQY